MLRMKRDQLTPQNQTIPSAGDELDAPPPYTPGTSLPATRAPTSIPPTDSRASPTPSSSLNTGSQGGDTPLLSREGPSRLYQRNQTPSIARSPSEHRDAYKPTPDMSMGSEDPWSKYNNQPGCCFSKTGGCCFSRRGGCCFSDTEGCCFSKNKGCCFSSDEACCFSSH